MRLRVLILIPAAGLSVLGAEVKLKGTTITGRDIPSYGVEFFGGSFLLISSLKMLF